MAPTPQQTQEDRAGRASQVCSLAGHLSGQALLFLLGAQVGDPLTSTGFWGRGSAWSDTLCLPHVAGLPRAVRAPISQPCCQWNPAPSVL